MQSNNETAIKLIQQFVGMTVSFLIVAAVIRLGWNSLIEPWSPETVITFKQGMGATLLLFILNTSIKSWGQA